MIKIKLRNFLLLIIQTEDIYHAKIVTEYRTVEARIPFAMEAMMLELLGDGYQPYGSPYVYSEADGSNICCQAMVRYQVVE